MPILVPYRYSIPHNTIQSQYHQYRYHQRDDFVNATIPVKDQYRQDQHQTIPLAPIPKSIGVGTCLTVEKKVNQKYFSCGEKRSDGELIRLESNEDHVCSIQFETMNEPMFDNGTFIRMKISYRFVFPFKEQ